MGGISAYEVAAVFCAIVNGGGMREIVVECWLGVKKKRHILVCLIYSQTL